MSNKTRALVVEDAIEAARNKRSPPPAYFYCSRNLAEPGRSDPEVILASIARQLSCLGPGLPLLQPAVDMYRMHEEEAFAAESLRLHQSRSLILELAGHYPVITIVIDAMDECNPDKRKSFLHAMEFILRESPTLIKIFVSSRNDQDIVFKLQGYPNLELSSDRNSEDIAMFVESEAKRLIEEGAMLRFSTKQEDLRVKIVTQVTSSADGM